MLSTKAELDSVPDPQLGPIVKLSRGHPLNILAAFSKAFEKLPMSTEKSDLQPLNIDLVSERLGVSIPDKSTMISDAQPWNIPCIVSTLLKSRPRRFTLVKDEHPESM